MFDFLKSKEYITDIPQALMIASAIHIKGLSDRLKEETKYEEFKYILIPLDYNITVANELNKQRFHYPVDFASVFEAMNQIRNEYNNRKIYRKTCEQVADVCYNFGDQLLEFTR